MTKSAAHTSDTPRPNSPRPSAETMPVESTGVRPDTATAAASSPTATPSADENGVFLSLSYDNKTPLPTFPKKETAMPDSNKLNLQFFESDSMRGLYETMKQWQVSHGKRLLSTNIQKDQERFCCIALTNPTEVVICNQDGNDYATVNGGLLSVFNFSS